MLSKACILVLFQSIRKFPHTKDCVPFILIVFVVETILLIFGAVCCICARVRARFLRSVRRPILCILN